MATQPTAGAAFIRKTQLGPDEYQKNFRQIDNDIIAAITSPDADSVTPLMSKIYLRLVSCPTQYWESRGVLRFEAEVRSGKHVKAWDVLCGLLGVSSATANKALAWLRKRQILGYFAGKNGVGIRIFLNRAANSIGNKADQPSKKILPFSRASVGSAPASRSEAPFKESNSFLENLEFNLSALPSVARGREALVGLNQQDSGILDSAANIGFEQGREPTYLALSPAALDSIVERVARRLTPMIESQQKQVRDWMEEKGLPKAIRVAQKEAFSVLKKTGSVNSSRQRSQAELMVGASTRKRISLGQLSEEELKDLADICLFMLDTKGQSFDVTLAEISSERRGFLLPRDASQVRAVAETLLRARDAIPESARNP
jgi:hypothetical protein